jgi:hypothetical protein
LENEVGISINFYTVYGIKIKGYPKDFTEAYDEVYDDKDTPFVICDGMCGEYVILGVKLFDSGDARWGFENGDDFKEIDIADLSRLESEYKNQFLAKFPEFGHLLNPEFKLMTLAYYS